MKKALKILLWTCLVVVVILVSAVGLFYYKIKNGFPVSYETEVPSVTIPAGQSAVLLFSKTTGFRHEEAIAASQPLFAEMAQRHQWFLYATEAGGVFHPDLLKKFKVVIFNNSTGRVLNDEQQRALEQYVEQGGTLLGIHGAGDDSHHWPWYETHLLGAQFSHHPLNPQFQPATVTLQQVGDSTLTQHLPQQWIQTDEWYVFFTKPKGMNILYAIDGTTIIPNGNVLWIRDKNFGMGKFHPVAWYRSVGSGKTFYTSMGHSKDVWNKPEFKTILENAIQWGMK